MPTPTYDLIASTTLAAASPSVTFSSIPATYRDLVLVYSGRTSGTADGDALNARFNGDTGSNYSGVRMGGLVGFGPFSNTFTETFTYIGRIDTSISSNIDPTPGVVSIMDYSATDKHKTTLSRSGYQRGLVDATATRWANTAAITTIELTAATGTNFVAGFTFNLYGIAS